MPAAVLLAEPILTLARLAQLAVQILADIFPEHRRRSLRQIVQFAHLRQKLYLPAIARVPYFNHFMLVSQTTCCLRGVITDCNQSPGL